MRFARALLMVLLGWLALGAVGWAQSGNASSISGTVTDPSGAVVANATVTIHNAVSGYDRSAATDSSGNFSFPNVPFNPYHLTVTAPGFASHAEDVDVRSTVPVNLKIGLIPGPGNGFGDRRSRGRPGGDRANRAHGHRPAIVQSGSTGEFIVFGEFAGNAGVARRCGRLQWTVPRTGRSRAKIRFRWMASPSQTSRARSFQTRFRWTRCSRWK